MDLITADEAKVLAGGARSRLSPRDFSRLAAFIESYAGIKMPPSKNTLLEGRLQKRVRARGLADLDAYCHYLFEQDGLASETVHLIDAVSTNKTDFFREPEQFHIMRDRLLPDMIRGRTHSQRPTVSVWSSACSTGAEPYTVAMVLDDFSTSVSPIQASILATDINSEVLEIARKGIYPEDVAGPIAPATRKRYVLRSRDRARGLIRIVPELRSMVRFARLNLMAPAYEVDAQFDMIFCRNVLIYFHRATQAQVLGRLCAHLRPGGHLFLGHSESINGLSLPLQALSHNVFVRTPS